MSLTKEKKKLLYLLEDYKQQNNLTVILEPTSLIHKDISLLRKCISNTKKNHSYSILGIENCFLPFLTLQDNILLDIQIKQKKVREQLAYFSSLVQLPQSAYKKQLMDNSLEIIFRAQMVRALLLKHTTFIIDNSFEQLTVQEIQNFLSLLKKVSVKEDVSVLLFTSNQGIASSSYVNKLIEKEKL